VIGTTGSTSTSSTSTAGPVLAATVVLPGSTRTKERLENCWQVNTNSNGIMELLVLLLRPSLLCWLELANNNTGLFPGTVPRTTSTGTTSSSRLVAVKITKPVLRSTSSRTAS
jgi:hypothetical protein